MLPAFASVASSEAPPRNIPGPNGPVEMLKSWQTVGSTVGAELDAALALGARTAIAHAAVTAARAATGFRRHNI
jgi:hypothetical protein